jgi:transcriptional regulator GlxA family with amidase domain
MAGLSARSIQYAFQEHYGTTPIRYLRKVRLDRAREDLRQGNATVADIASYWGFSNMGRFRPRVQDAVRRVPVRHPESRAAPAPPRLTIAAGPSVLAAAR